MDVQFYDVKSRQKVTVPQSEVKKTKYERTTKEGKTQVRYALRGEYNGTKLTKFVSEADWKAMDAPME